MGSPDRDKMDLKLTIPTIEKAHRAGDTLAACKILKEVGYEVVWPSSGSVKYIITDSLGVETNIKTTNNFFFFLKTEIERLGKL